MIVSAIYRGLQSEGFANLNKLITDSYSKKLRKMYVSETRWDLVLNVEDDLNYVLPYLK